MIIVGLPHTFAGRKRLGEITGCSPYGASTMAAADQWRKPTENELAGARLQGRHVAMITSQVEKWANLPCSTG